MKKTKVIAGLVLIFLSGILVGGFTFSVYVKKHVQDIMHGGPEFRNRMILGLYEDKLDLSESQRTQVTEIFNETNSQLFDIFENQKPEIEKIIETRTTRMKTILNPEQQKTLDEIHAMLKEHFERQIDRHHRHRKHRAEKDGPETALSSRSSHHKKTSAISKIVEELSLSPEQKRHIEEIQEKAEKDINDLSDEYRLQIETKTEEQIDSIKELLDTTQIQLFEAALAEDNTHNCHHHSID